MSWDPFTSKADELEIRTNNLLRNLTNKALQDGGGAGNYDPMQGGLVVDGSFKTTAPKGTYVYAEKGGKPGFMLPGRPETWRKGTDNPKTIAAARTRHRALKLSAPAPETQQTRPTASLSSTPPTPLATTYTGADGVEYEYGSGRPKGAPEGGYSLEPDGTMTPHTPVTEPEKPEETKPQNPAPVSEAGDESGTVRTNKNGITQKGMNLGGIQNFLKFNPDLKLADGADFFNFDGKKTDTEKPYKTGEHTISGEDTGYEISGKSTPIHKLGDTSGVKATVSGVKQTAYSIPDATVPLTTGHSVEDVTSGVSSAADNADQTRALSMKPFRGSERQREFADRPGNRPPVSEASAVKPTGGDKARRTYGRAFLDSTSKGPMGVLRDAAASIGVIRTNDGKISIKDGDGYRTYTGDASAREVAFDLGGGQKGYDKHAAGFKKIVPEKPADTSTDDEQTPATIQDISQMDVTTPEWKNQGQAFADHYKKQLKEGNK